jgi:hypothetical protein
VIDPIIKENRRTTYEWDKFMSKYGLIVNYDDLTDDAKAEACKLAEAQGERWNRIELANA